MRTHQEIDRRSLALARAVVEKIDNDPERRGLHKAKENCARWVADNPSPALDEWMTILSQDWSVVRAKLLDPGETGQRLRQSNPFCGVLSAHERWAIYRQHNREPEAA